MTRDFHVHCASCIAGNFSSTRMVHIRSTPCARGLRGNTSSALDQLVRTERDSTSGAAIKRSYFTRLDIDGVSAIGECAARRRSSFCLCPDSYLRVVQGAVGAD